MISSERLKESFLSATSQLLSNSVMDYSILHAWYTLGISHQIICLYFMTKLSHMLGISSTTASNYLAMKFYFHACNSVIKMLGISVQEGNHPARSRHAR